MSPQIVPKSEGEPIGVNNEGGGATGVGWGEPPKKMFFLLKKEIKLKNILK